jgi:hypothetical protein
VADLPCITGLSSSTTTVAGCWVDQSGSPRFLMMDNPWALIVNAGEWGGTWESDISTYLRYKQAQGYTGVYVSALGCLDINGRYENGNTWDNVSPWSNGSDPSGGLNGAYWERVDYLTSTAYPLGITIFLNICYTANNGEGTFDEGGALYGLTQQQYTDYGTALAGRYSTAPNLVWMYGNDYYDGLYDAEFGYVRSAITGTGDTHAMAVHDYPESTSRYDIESADGPPLKSTFSSSYSQVIWVYSYNVLYYGIELAYEEAVTHSIPMIPAMWGDGYFYTDGGTGIPTDQYMEQMAWWTIASGGRGLTGTSNNVWPWSDASLTDSETENWYAHTAPAIVAALTALPQWWQLMPDTNSTLVTSGRGTHASGITTGAYYAGGTDDYVAASYVPADGGSPLAVIYCAQAFSITIDQSVMAPGYAAYWVDPASGAKSPATAGSAYSSSDPGNNSAGYPDWVLVLQAASPSSPPSPPQGLLLATGIV